MAQAHFTLFPHVLLAKLNETARQVRSVDQSCRLPWEDILQQLFMNCDAPGANHFACERCGSREGNNLKLLEDVLALHKPLLEVGLH